MSTPKQGESLTNLLVCYSCKTIEEIPYTTNGKYLGDGKYDQSENPFIEPIADPHFKKGCKGRLFDVDTMWWISEKGRDSTLKQIKEQLLGGSKGLDVFGTDFYNVKANYSADAMNCYNLHLRPQNGCSDYKIDAKILKPDTDAERKEAGLAKTTVKTYLCDFCPAKIAVQKKVFTKKGLYS